MNAGLVQKGELMLERWEKALSNHKRGYNCAQSVVCAYCDLFDIEEKTAFRIAEGFGLGMGSMGTCGAVAAMSMIVGMKESDGNLEKPTTKKVCYKKMKQLSNEFEKKNGSLICSEIKGVDTGVVLRSCNGCMEDACKLLDEYL